MWLLLHDFDVSQNRSQNIPGRLEERGTANFQHTFTNFSHAFVISVQENLLQWCAAGRMDKSAAGLLCDPICTVCSAESWDFHNELRGNNRRQNPLVLVFIILKSKMNVFKVFSRPNNCRIVYYIQPFTNEPQLLAKHETEHGIFLQFLGHWTEIQEVPLIWVFGQIKVKLILLINILSDKYPSDRLIKLLICVLSAAIPEVQ